MSTPQPPHALASHPSVLASGERTPVSLSAASSGADDESAPLPTSGSLEECCPPHAINNDEPTTSTIQMDWLTSRFGRACFMPNT